MQGSSKPTIVTIDNEFFFICDYTGAPCKKRFFIPTGKHLKGKVGCYCTLPVLLRHVYEQQPDSWEKTKQLLEQYYQQPNIPMQPPLHRRLVTADDLMEYLMELDMGMAWLRVGKAQEIDEAQANEKRKKPKLE